MKNVSIPALSIEEPDCHGMLYKQGNTHKTWKKRYCVLKYGCLYYYEDMSDMCAIGVFKLKDYLISYSTNTKNGFEAIAPDEGMRSYFFYCENERDLDK